DSDPDGAIAGLGRHLLRARFGGLDGRLARIDRGPAVRREKEGVQMTHGNLRCERKKKTKNPAGGDAHRVVARASTIRRAACRRRSLRCRRARKSGSRSWLSPPLVALWPRLESSRCRADRG